MTHHPDASTSSHDLREAVARTEMVVRLYAEGRTLREIAPLVNLTHGGVQSVLRRNGVALRRKVRRPGLPSSPRISGNWKQRALAAEAELAILKAAAARDAEERLPHMCRDNHPVIRHADSGDDERCPVCRERDRADAAVEDRDACVMALEAKVAALAPHGTCACSYDKPGDVCAHHSPAISTAEARGRAAGLEEAAEDLDRLAGGYARAVDTNREQRGDAEAAIALTASARCIRALAATPPEPPALDVADRTEGDHA
jgi:hypothetical protein